MPDEFIPFSPPLIGEEEIAEVVDTLRSDWITTGPKAKRFENEFAEYVSGPAALGLNSCTAALHVALATLGIGAGDEVISTPLTFCSSIHVIEQLGARPILADVQPDTLNIDPVQVTNLLRSRPLNRVKALLPVHLYGHPCDMDALCRIAEEHNVAIVEDAAHALPAKYEGKFVGSLAGTLSVPVATCFSFYATKNITTAEGGMLVSTQKFIDEARIWSLHGMSRDAWKRYSNEGSWFYEVVRAGFKYNLTDLQAAIGIHQLRKLHQFQCRRQEIVARYNEAFSSLPGIVLPTVRPGVDHAWHIYMIRLADADFKGSSDDVEGLRNHFVAELQRRKIGVSVHFIPIHLHPFYRDRYGYKPYSFPVAYDAYRRMLSLPLCPKMTDAHVEAVIRAVREVAEEMGTPNGAPCTRSLQERRLSS